MKILVTGANGFIGSNLVKKLIEAGHQVDAMVLKGTNEEFIKDLNCKIVYGDVTQKETLEGLFHDIEVVYHLAAVPSSEWSNRIVNINFEGTKNVAEECIKQGVRRLVFMSSLVVHGFKDFEGADESTPLIKAKWYKRPYIKSKILCEDYLRGKHDEMEIVIIRPGFTIFGPHDILTSKELIGRLDSGKNVPNINGGGAKMCYIYVENLADILVLAGSRPEAAGQTYLAADNSPPYITMKRFNKAICEELGRKPSKGSIPYLLAAPFVALLDLIYRLFLRKKLPLISMYTLKVAKFNLFFQSNKVEQELGYTSKISFKEAVKRTVEWYKTYFSED